MDSVQVFAKKGNSIFVFTNGSIRKALRYNIKKCKGIEFEENLPVHKGAGGTGREGWSPSKIHSVEFLKSK